MRTIRHMSTNIEGLLRNYKGKKINILDDDNGRTMSDAQARKEITGLQAKGHKLIPCGDCEGFDPFGKGCPGHEVVEMDRSTIDGYGKIEECEISCGKFHLKITDGFQNNAIRTFELMGKAMDLAGDEYPIIDKCVTDNNIFYLILKSNLK